MIECNLCREAATWCLDRQSGDRSLFCEQHARSLGHGPPGRGWAKIRTRVPAEVRPISVGAVAVPNRGRNP